MLFCIDTLGNLVRSLQLNHRNQGWEGLAFDREGTLYVGAFGNNKNDKRELKIYVVPNPDSIKENVYTAGVIRYHYQDQRTYPANDAEKNFDMDALVATDDALFLFSKNRTKPFNGYTKIYKLPKKPGTFEAVPYDSIYLGSGPMIDRWVTGADLSPDGNSLVLLSHQYLWVIRGFHDQKFSTGTIERISMEHFSHKAGVVFARNNQLYVVDELEFGLLGGNLYRITLPGANNNPQ